MYVFSHITLDDFIEGIAVVKVQGSIISFFVFLCICSPPDWDNVDQLVEQSIATLENHVREEEPGEPFEIPIANHSTTAATGPSTLHFDSTRLDSTQLDTIQPHPPQCFAMQVQVTDLSKQTTTKKNFFLFHSTLRFSRLSHLINGPGFHPRNQ